MDIAALTRSSRPAFGSRNSGKRTGPSASKSSMSGTLMRNTEPHQKCVSKSPPTIGPIAAPVEKLATHMLMAVVRSLGSWNMLRMSESVEGASVADARPRPRVRR